MQRASPACLFLQLFIPIKSAEMLIAMGCGRIMFSTDRKIAKEQDTVRFGL